VNDASSRSRAWSKYSTARSGRWTACRSPWRPAASTACWGLTGAGKTTLIRVLATLLVPDAGSARVAGIDVRHHPEQVRARIGLAGQSAAVDEHLTGRRTSSWSAACMGCPATRPAAAAARSWSGSA